MSIQRPPFWHRPEISMPGKTDRQGGMHLKLVGRMPLTQSVPQETVRVRCWCSWVVLAHSRRVSILVEPSGSG